MPWFKVDDNLAFHAKAVAAGNPAMGLWVRAGSWCAQQLTDGFVPDHMLAALGTKQQADRLVSQRLWDRVEGGYRFHGWTERQPSKGDVEAERAAARERMKAFRAKKKGVEQDASSQVSDSRSPEQTENEHGTSPEVRDSFGNPDPTHPDPSRPDPSNKRRAGQGERFDEFWAIYPRRVDRGHALKAWTKAAKSNDEQAIIDAARRYAAKVGNADPKFIPHASTWLNGERWLDEDVTAGPALFDEPTEVFQIPLPPAEVADDPAAYQRWVHDKRAEWDARRAGGDR